MKLYLKPDDIYFALANLPQLTFEVTDACNLKCTYCGYGEFYEDYDSRENQMLPIDKAIRLIDRLNEFWNSDKNMSASKNVTISFYGGEPLLNMPFIKAIINYLNSLNCLYRQFSFSMTTNALLLPKYADFLVEHDFNLLISLDGNKENTGYRIDKQNNPAFDRIVANTDNLREKYPDYFTEKVQFNAVLHNKNSVEEIYRFFKNRYNKIPYIGELNGTGIRKSKQEEFLKTYKNPQESLQQSEHYEEIERDMFINSATYRSAGLFLRKYGGFTYHNYLDLLFDKREYRATPTGTCLPFSRKMYVTVNGKILPCEYIGHHFALGEITDTDINLDTEAIAAKYNTYFAKMEKQCSHCKNTKACKQCMFNLSDLDNKPACNGFMNEKDFEDYAAAQYEFLQKHPEAYSKLMDVIVR